MNAVAEARLASAAKESVESPALVVDLDGTLVKTDLLLEAVLVLLKQKLYYAFRLLLWLMKGKAYFKRQVARQVSLDVAVLPYREEVLDYLREQRAHGRKLVLATGCDIQIAVWLRITWTCSTWSSPATERPILPARPNGIVW